MMRRCISTFLITGLLFSQLAAFPHVHGGGSAAEQQRHDATPHFHYHWNSHKDCGEVHFHSTRLAVSHLRSDGKSQREPLSEGLTSASHDADAIFVQIHPGTPPKTSQIESAIAQLAVFARFFDQPIGIELGIHSPLPWHPPDEIGDESDIYLTLRNLRL